MIPAYLNDGFTAEVSAGVFCRPMLWAEKKAWREIAASSTDDGWYRLIQHHVYGDPTGLSTEERARVVEAVLGYTVKDENRDFQDLNDTVQLHATNPGLSLASCQTCRAYCFNHETGEVYFGPSGQPTPLPKNIKVPCETQRGCLKGHWSEPVGLSNDKWLLTWRHFWRHRFECPLQDELWHRNRMLIEWTVLYGRDKRFDPFVGGSSNGRAADDPSERTARQDRD
jgi:hypothetical protein